MISEERATDAVIQSVVSRAAADVIMEDASWDDALSAALDAGQRERGLLS